MAEEAVIVPEGIEEDLTLDQIASKQAEFNRSNRAGKEPVVPKFFEEIKKNTGLEFKSYDELKGLHSKASEYEAKSKEWEAKTTEFENLSNQLKSIEAQKNEFERLARENSDPLKPYGGKKEKYIQVKLEEKYPDREHLVGEVMNYTKKSDLENVINEKLWDNPELNRSQIITHLSDKYGVDVEELSRTPVSEWDANILVKVKLDAKDAKKSLGGLLSEIQVPEFVDPTLEINKQQEEKAEKAKQRDLGWNKILKESDYIERAFDEIVIQDLDKDGKVVKTNVDDKEIESEPLLTWKIEPEVLKKIPSLVEQVIKQYNLEPTDEAKVEIAKYIKNIYKNDPINEAKMFNEYAKNLRAKWEAEKAIIDNVPRKEKVESRGDVKVDSRSKYYDGLQ